MTDLPEFKEFDKLYRWHRRWIVSEKIDGTNACIHISDDGKSILAGSRSKWLPNDGGLTKDNMGFRNWVNENTEELLKLGPGYHYGEWWGKGIQRGYDVPNKRFSLFNCQRWKSSVVNNAMAHDLIDALLPDRTECPKCCLVVPIIDICEYQNFDWRAVEDVRTNGSLLNRSFKKPEGVVFHHVPGCVSFKYTFDGDGHKGAK